MAQKTKQVVTTEVGTFTRTTARSYSHIVVIKDERADVLEAERIKSDAYTRRLIAAYVDGRGIDGRVMNPEWIADGSRDKWVEKYRAKLAASQPITADRAFDWTVYGWSGRLDLARKTAASSDLRRYREVRIYEVATGTRVA